MSKTLIEVKQQHIREGKCLSPSSCPIAKAIREKANMLHGVTQEGADFIKSFADNTDGIPLPEEAVNFIIAFDNSEIVKPFSFYLDIPDEYLKS